MHVIAEEVEESKTNIEFIIRGSHLDKKDFFGKVWFCNRWGVSNLRMLGGARLLMTRCAIT